MCMYAFGKCTDFPRMARPGNQCSEPCPMHTHFFAYENTEAATEAVKEKSVNYMTLNGIWKFRWTKDSDARPTDFWKTDFNDKGWDNLGSSRDVGTEWI